MDQKERVIRHLEMIQAIISRMAQNSFLLKGWIFTLIAAGSWINYDSDDVLWVCVLFTLILLFWLLDGYFLNQERLFRKLFDHIRVSESTNFSMKTDPAHSNWFKTLFSITLLIFYGGLLLLTGICLLYYFFILR